MTTSSPTLPGGNASGPEACGTSGTRPKPSPATCNSATSAMRPDVPRPACAQRLALGARRSTRTLSARGGLSGKTGPDCCLAAFWLWYAPGKLLPAAVGARGKFGPTGRYLRVDTRQSIATCCIVRVQWETSFHKPDSCEIAHPQVERSFCATGLCTGSSNTSGVCGSPAFQRRIRRTSAAYKSPLVLRTV